jgi:ATP-dependent Clp protease ATP-binding subunit ClpA
MFTRDLEMCLMAAQSEAKGRRHEYLCVEHILYALLHNETGARIIRSCGGNVDRIKEDLEEFFDQQEVMRDDESTPQQTRAVQRVLHLAIMHVNSSGKASADVGDILVAIHRESQSYASYFLQKEGITRLDLLNYISHGIAKVPVEDEEENANYDNGDEDEGSSQGRSEQDALKHYTTNLTKQAEEDRIDPLIGREAELERTIQILCRRRKNNPIYVGDPGVGKTAIAEGLALRIFQADVPELLQESEIYALDIGALLAGTKFRGDFEQRIKAVLKALQQKPKSILFIDEIHTIIGAGATSGGSMDVSNLLKPALAKGEIRCVGSTTYDEYKKLFEKDRALSRRFQKIDVDEPSIEETFLILKGLKSRYEEHHELRYTQSSLKMAAELSAKYINDRFLPDKAIDVIDETGAAIRLKGGDRKTVNAQDIEKVVASIARVPIDRMNSSDKERLRDLEKELKMQVFGQNDAIHALVQAIKRSRAGLRQADQPIGSFLFTGPTGVGKTELAKQLAHTMGIHFQRFDMSEYMEKHTVSRLIGAPPGYVGYDQGGLLTDAIRKHPHAVLLLDEIEKAHPDIFNILLQVMDHATLTDNNGREADFRNVVLIMTSNVGAKEMTSNAIGFGNATPSSPSKQALERTFSPEFRNRLDATIPFSQLPKEVVQMIVDKLIIQLENKLQQKKVTITITPEARAWLADKGYDPMFGARPMKRVIQQEIETVLADEVLFGKLESGGEVTITLEDHKLGFAYT